MIWCIVLHQSMHSYGELSGYGVSVAWGVWCDYVLGVCVCRCVGTVVNQGGGVSMESKEVGADGLSKEVEGG